MNKKNFILVFVIIAIILVLFLYIFGKIRNSNNNQIEEVTLNEYKDVFLEAYSNIYGFTPENIELNDLGENNIKITVHNDGVIIDEYILNTSSFIASNNYGININIKTKEIENSINTNVEFNDSELVAVGIISDELEVANKYFVEPSQYNNIQNIKFGDDVKFIIIPKNNNARIKVYKNELSGNNYSVELESEVVGRPFVVTTKTFEIYPSALIEYDDGNTKFNLELYLSGKDGTLVLNELADKVKDISIYK